MPEPKQNQNIILWDIDGTLVNAHASRADKHVIAVEVFLGRDLSNQERTAGKTDQQILCELLEAQETFPSHAALTEVLRILDEISIKEINQYPVSCNPGVTNALKMASSAGWIKALSRGGLVSSSLRAISSVGCSVAIVIGDTPLDIRSAKEHKLQVVAVATGPHSAAELRGLDPDLLINDCESGWAPLVAFLDSMHV